MKAFDSATLTMLASGRASKRDLMLLDLVEGTFGFWSGVGIMTYGGINYVGAGGLISLDASAQVMDLSAMPLVGHLTSVPNSELTPDVLATIETYTYHQRPVTVSRAYVDPDTQSVLSVERWFRGYIDRVEHELNVGQNGAARLNVYCESKARDHQKKGYRTRSDADQRRINLTDAGLQYTAVAGQQTVNWGRSTTPAGSQVPALGSMPPVFGIR